MASRLIQFLALLLVIVVSACGNESSPSVPGLQSLLTAMNEPMQKGTDDVGRRKRLHVYLDASESMRGFVVPPRSRFRRAVDHLLDRTAAAGYDVNFYRFDAQVTALPASFSAANIVSNPDFFSGSETSFPRLFEKVRNQRRPGEIAIIVTDLVQSGRTGDQRELSRAFHDSAIQQPEVLLLALRSAFRGSYWPESTLERDKIEIVFQTEEPTKSRPFYILFMADGSVDLEIIKRRLELNVGEENGSSSWHLDASRPAALISEVIFKDLGDSGSSGWKESRKPQQIPPKGRTYRKVFWLLGQLQPSVSIQSARFEVGGRGEDILDIKKVEVKARRCAFALGRPVGEPLEVDLNARLNRDESGQISVDLDFPAPMPNSWEGYHVQLFPGAANLGASIQLELWTTDADAALAQANRTYKLDLFVETMLNALREPVPFLELYVFLGRGE